MTQNETAGGLTVNRQTLRDGLALVRDTGKAGGNGLTITGRSLVASDGQNVVSVELRGGRGEVSATVPAVLLTQWAAVGAAGDRLTVTERPREDANPATRFTVDAINPGGGARAATVNPPTNPLGHSTGEPLTAEGDEIRASATVRAERWARVLTQGGHAGARSQFGESRLGWQIEIEANTVRIVSTDGAALASAETEALPVSTGSASRIAAGIPADSVKMLANIVRNVEGTVSIVLLQRDHSRYLRVEVTPTDGNGTIGRRVALIRVRESEPLPEGWADLAPGPEGYGQDSARSFTVPRSALRAALRAVRVFGPPPTVSLTIENDALRVSAAIPETGGAELGGTAKVSGVAGDWSEPVCIVPEYASKAIDTETADVLTFHCHGNPEGQWGLVPADGAPRLTIGVLNPGASEDEGDSEPEIPEVEPVEVIEDSEPMEAVA